VTAVQIGFGNSGLRRSSEIRSGLGAVYRSLGSGVLAGRAIRARAASPSHVSAPRHRALGATRRCSRSCARCIDKWSGALGVDGDVCVFDRQLVSQFHPLGDQQDDKLATPPVYTTLDLFDLLHARGRDLRPQLLSYRRPALKELIAGSNMVVPTLHLDGDGLEALREVKRRGWEGLVTKDEASPYVGGRTRRWLKVKVRYEAGSSWASTCRAVAALLCCLRFARGAGCST
jgi:hypothetical protein